MGVSLNGEASRPAASIGSGVSDSARKGSGVAGIILVCEAWEDGGGIDMSPVGDGA